MICCLSYDIGTTGVKTCVFDISDKIKLIGSASASYGLYVLDNGGAEQDPDEWWDGMRSTTAQALQKAGVSADDIAGVSFCSQMQGLVAVDKDGRALRRAMSYMDQRATAELKKGIAHGPCIAGANVVKLLRSLSITGAVAASVKDPVWKYKWIESNEPDVFERMYKWLDVKEYLILRATGNFIATPDSAFATLLYDIRQKKWSDEMCRMLGVRREHLPDIIPCDAQAGVLTPAAAEQLGLKAGTPVFGGGGDATAIGVGAGAVEPGETHVYVGTSGWVSTVTDRSLVDTSSMIAAVVGARDGYYNYFAELETAGKCLEWVKDHLALDEIGVYLQSRSVADVYETKYRSLYDYMTEIIERVPAGSNGVVFTPWMHGNRCPFEDPFAKAMFFNIGLDNGKSDMIRSVVEGVCCHLRWFIECQDKKLATSDTVRFVGGGALSPATCRILADVTGKAVQTVESPQNAGAVGAAVLTASGLGLIGGVGDARSVVVPAGLYEPDPANKNVYDNVYGVFKGLWKANKKGFAALNDIGRNTK